MSLTIKAGGAGLQRRRLRDTPAAWLLLAPMLVLFCLSVIYPLFETIRLSFWDIRGLSKPEFAGIDNYLALAIDPVFRGSMLVTIKFALATTILSVGVGWGVAMLCSFAPHQTTIFRIVIFSAFGVSETVAAYMWTAIFRADEGGLLNTIIGAFGVDGFAFPWLGDSDTALMAIIVSAAWSWSGLALLLCYASVQSIPKSVLEAAYMDGAKPLSIMWHIMMPMSMPGVRAAVFINLLASLRVFDVIYVLTGGGPMRSTETLGFFMYRESVAQFKLGYGAAATVILLVAVLVISVPAIIKRTEEAT